MSRSLDEFLNEARHSLDMFEDMWRRKHSDNPEHFPMEMVEGNEGLWWEMFLGFDGDAKEETPEFISEDEMQL